MLTEGRDEACIIDEGYKRGKGGVNLERRGKKTNSLSITAASLCAYCPQTPVVRAVNDNKAERRMRMDS